MKTNLMLYKSLRAAHVILNKRLALLPVHTIEEKTIAIFSPNTCYHLLIYILKIKILRMYDHVQRNVECI